MLKLLKLKIRAELEEIRAAHRIAIKEKEAEIALVKKNADQELEIKTREVTSLLKLKHEQEIAQMKLDYDRKLQDQKKKMQEDSLALRETLLKENHDKLGEALNNLHEKGNVTTKFMQEMAVGMLKQIPAAKVETKNVHVSLPSAQDDD